MKKIQSNLPTDSEMITLLLMVGIVIAVLYSLKKQNEKHTAEVNKIKQGLKYSDPLGQMNIVVTVLIAGVVCIIVGGAFGYFKSNGIHVEKETQTSQDSSMQSVPVYPKSPETPGPEINEPQKSSSSTQPSSNHSGKKHSVTSTLTTHVPDSEDNI